MSGTNKIHENIEHWLDASLKGRLDATQRGALREHLGECSVCMQAACDPELVDRAMDILSRRGGPDEQFEGRVVQGMRSEAQGDNKTVPVLARRGTRVALRVALAVLFLALLGVRSLNLRYFRNDSWSAQALSALGQVFLREPSVETPNRLPYGINQDQRRLAIAHQLTKGFAGLLMWLSLLLLVLFLARDLWVVRTRLRA